MSNINFFTPITYPTSSSISRNSMLEGVDNYFYLGGKKAFVIGTSIKGHHKVILLESKISFFETATKIISYCTLIIPLIMLFKKLAIRKNQTFKVIDLNQKIKKGLKPKFVENIKEHMHLLFDAKTSEGRIFLSEIAKSEAKAKEGYIDLALYKLDTTTVEGRATCLETGRTLAAKRGFHYDIGDLGFDTKTSQGIADVLELATIAAVAHGNEVSKNIAEYGLDPSIPEAKKALFEIAKISAKHHPHQTSIYIKKYGFDPRTSEGREMLLEIAKIALSQSSSSITNYAFDADTLEGQTALLEIYKIAAGALAHGDGISSLITQCNFATKTVEGRAALLEIAKISAAQNGVDTSRHIAKYGFDVKTVEGRAALLEIAKIAANDDKFDSFSEHIANYGFDAKTPEGRAALFEIAKINAVKNPVGLAKSISRYGFDSKTFEGRNALLEIAKMNASHRYTRISHLIKNFEFDANTVEGRAALIEIAKISAKSRPSSTSAFIENYGIDRKMPEGRAALFEIAKIAAAKNGKGTVKNINRYGFDSKTLEGKAMLLDIGVIAMGGGDNVHVARLMNKMIAHPVFTLYEACDDINKFSSEAENCNHFPLIFQLLTLVKEFKNDQAKLQLLPLIAYCHYKLHIYSSKLNLRNFDKEATQNFSSGASEHCLGQGASEDKNLDAKPTSSKFSDSALMSIYKGQKLEQVFARWKKTFFELIKTRDPQLRFYLADILFEFIEKNSEKEALSLLETTFELLYIEKKIPLQGNMLLKSIKKKDIKDATLQKTLLWTFIELVKNENVSGDTTHKVLKTAIEKDSRSKIINELMKIRAIINLKGVEELQQPNLDLAVKNLIQKKYPGLSEGVENLSDSLNRTFLSSRNPFAFFTYAAGLATLPHENLVEPLSIFFKSVLNGTFKEMREATGKNPHLKELKKKYPKLMEAWFKGDKQLDCQLGETKEEKSIPTRTILKNALVRDKHFPEVDPLLLAVLDGTKDEDEIFKETIIKIKNTKKEAQAPLVVTRDLLRLLDPKLKEDQRTACIGQIIKNLPPSGAELINDLNSLLPKKAAVLTTVTLSDTDDPFDILYCGSEVDGSCQRIGGCPSMNRGLLGYLLNGQTRLITLKQADGANIPITARAIVRLQFGEKGEPVMLMERIYPQTLTPEMKDALVSFTLKRATSLGIDLVSVEEGSLDHAYAGALKNLGGSISEYVDSAGGIQAGGYEVKKAYLVKPLIG